MDYCNYEYIIFKLLTIILSIRKGAMEVYMKERNYSSSPVCMTKLRILNNELQIIATTGTSKHRLDKSGR